MDTEQDEASVRTALWIAIVGVALTFVVMAVFQDAVGLFLWFLLDIIF